MSPLSRAFSVCLLCLSLLTMAACSNTNDQAFFDPSVGHPDDWLTRHGVTFMSSLDCITCHGDDLRGGISQISCYSSSFEGTACHAGGPPTGRHPSDWGAGTVHGPAAKAFPGAGTGFASCEVCHGSTFAGGTSGTSCYTCHGVSAPHPASPWRGGAYTHTTTSGDNAPVCATCHRSVAGTAGCFNGTLCHGAAGSPHPSGWRSPASHGPAAKASPGSAKGFAYCSVCHGSTFSGGSSGHSCFTCHGVSAPHPPSPWRGGIYTHTSTASGNAPVCAICHRSNAGTAGCFNDSLCHGSQ